MTKINEDGFTDEDIKTTLRVLNHLQDHAEIAQGESTSRVLEQSQVLVTGYEQQSEWRKERAGDRVDLSENATLSDCVGIDGER